jgi:hypothetical protein
LLGAAATGVFSIAKDMLVEGRRERAVREQLWRREMQDGRVACLLIADELDTLAMNFRLVAEKKRAPMRTLGESPFLSTREWHSNQVRGRARHRPDGHLESAHRRVPRRGLHADPIPRRWSFSTG